MLWAEELLRYEFFYLVVWAVRGDVFRNWLD